MLVSERRAVVVVVVVVDVGVLVCIGRRKEEVGRGREMIDPKKAMLVIHFEERRGSRVRFAVDQYLLDKW